MDRPRGVRAGDRSRVGAAPERRRTDGGWFEPYVPLLEARVRRLLPRAIRRRVSVADVVQEARIVALRWEEEHDLASIRSVRAWLLEIAERKTREATRNHAETQKRAARREVSQGGRPDTGAFPAHIRSPSQQAMAAEARDLVKRTLASLPDEYREILRLARLEGLSLGEIAFRLGKSREAVKKLYGRAVQRFTRALGAAGEERGVRG